MSDPTRFRDVAATMHANGYRPLPIAPGEKRPGFDKWQTFAYSPGCERRYPEHGAGVLLGDVVGLDIDVDDPDAAATIEHAARRILGIGDAAKIPRRIGNAPRVLIPFRTATPFRKITSATYTLRSTGSVGKIEILAEGQQFVAFAIHPTTKKPYYWNGGGDLLTVPRDQLHAITEAQAREIVSEAETILEEWGERVGERAHGERHDEQGTVRVTPQQVTELRSALNAIPADDYTTWTDMGAALKELGNVGRELWLTWSQTSDKYDATTAAAKWRVLKHDRTGYRAVFTRAARHGWVNPASNEARGDAGTRDDPQAWTTPINLFRGIAAPPLTAADVPRVIGEYAEIFARGGGFDPTGPIVAGICAAAAVIDDGIRLLLPGVTSHFASARPWIATIGGAGAGKSPAQKIMLAPVYALHVDMVNETMRRREAADEGVEVPQAALLTSDCTIDKLSELLAHNTRGMLYTVDELDSWLGQHEAFGREGGSRNRGEWMRLYDGGPNQVDRVKRGSYFVANWGTSVLTATTPAALRKLSPKLSADGLFARFMVFYVQPMRERDESITLHQVDGARRAYADRLQAVFAHVASTIGKPYVRFSPEAMEAYRAEERRIHALCDAAEAISDRFAGHVAKHVGMLARVALTFHAMSDELLDGAGNPRHPCHANVSITTMNLAARFMRRAYAHAYAIYTDCLGAGESFELAQAMGRSILADRMESFNSTEMSHRCRAYRPTDSRARANAMQMLADFGWIDGGGWADEYGARRNVNPAVHELHRAEAERAVSRRAAVKDAIDLDSGAED